MEDILNEVGIAKGTLYYHFASKEEILRGLISRTTAQIAEKARAIADTDAPVADKFLAVAATARVEEPERGLAEEFHAAGNAEFHVLSLVEGVRVLAPILTEIVEQGIAEGVFSTEHPPRSRRDPPDQRQHAPRRGLLRRRGGPGRAPRHRHHLRHRDPAGLRARRLSSVLGNAR